MTDLDKIKHKIRPVLQKYGIKKAGIFGSVARGDWILLEFSKSWKMNWT